MSPRGRAIPDVEQRLFDAAERVLTRQGPSGLSSRAITDEAGTATGLLFSHFADFDAFLAAFAHARFSQMHDAIGRLPERAGSRTVAENLTDAALSVAPSVSQLIDLVHSRPSVAARLHEAGHHHRGGFEEIRRSFEAYLEAERAAGRVAAEIDAETVAFALAAAVHQLSWKYGPGHPELPRAVGRLVAALVAGYGTREGHQRGPPISGARPPAGQL